MSTGDLTSTLERDLMPYPSMVIHHDAPPSRVGVRVWTPDRARIHTDLLMTQAHHQRTGSDR